MKICIVEDNPVHQRLLLEYIKEIDEENKYEYKIFSDAESFLFSMEDMDFHTILLDIEMPGINGVQLAKKIRENNTELPIAFITGEKDYVFEGYEVEAIGYLLKPIDKKQLKDLINRISKKLNIQEKKISIKDEEGIHLVTPSSIIYIESRDHKTEVFTKDKNYLCNTKMYQWEEELDENTFLKIHRCTLVNLNRINKILKNQCQMDNGALLNISRGQREILFKRFLDNQRGKNNEL